MVNGYLRGTASLSVNDLVHIPGFGNFQMLCMKTLEDPYLIGHERKKYLSDNKMKTEQRNEAVILTADPEKQVSRTHFNIYDWSLELEMVTKKYS